ncbi:MAG: UDP-N-acetylmuramoyl-tripeptide--D-alanyl-D-alanine ligase [Propioniciclava sp.]
MKPTPLSDVAQVTGGRVEHAENPTVLVGPEVVIDSRQVSPGALFVALPGEHVDGHAYVAAAGEAGAAAAIVERPVADGIPQIVVADPVAALSALATWIVRGAPNLTVVGITGSAGKTSTKDLVAHLLESAGPTIAPPGSFNNEIGAPLTACRVAADSRFLVAEMGARGLGHVAELARIIPPTIGVVLNVGSAHVGEFGSAAIIAQAKGELVEALDARGWAVLNADDPRVIAMAARTAAPIVAFSAVTDPHTTGAAVRIWATDIVADPLQRHSFTLHLARGAAAESAPVTLGLVGDHQVLNALAAAGAAAAAGLSIEEIATRLSTAIPRSPWRMELTERRDGVTILNDAYNANPEAVLAALGTLTRLRRGSGRLVAALGDMLELGDDSSRAHRDVGRRAAELGIDELVAIGDFAAHMVAGFGVSSRPARSVATIDDMTRHLRATLTPADVVLLKASRGLGLERVALTLVDDQEGADS